MYADLCHHFKPHQHVEQPLPVILRGAHCCRSGRKLDFGFQRQFQRHMNHQVVGFQEI